MFLFFNALVDLIVVTGGFALVQELYYVNVWDFPRYFLSVVAGGLGNWIDSDAEWAGHCDIR